MGNGGGAREEIFLWCLILVAGICLLGTVVWWLRRWSFSTDEALDEEAWSLQHLRQMRAKGQITQAEFETLKRQALKRFDLETTRKDSATPRGPSDA